MNPLRVLPSLSVLVDALRRRGARARTVVNERLPRLRQFYADDRSGSDGVIWEPLILTAFVLGAALTGASSPVAQMFADGSADGAEERVQRAEAPPPVGTQSSGALLSVPTPEAVPVPTRRGRDESNLDDSDGDHSARDSRELAANVERSRAEARTDATHAPMRADRPAAHANPNRALIDWWNDERWETRDEEAAEWRRDWLRIARANPERVPLELWLSVLEWAPNDRQLLRSASRAASRYTSRRARRAGWRAGPDQPGERSRLDVAREIEQAIRDAERRADYEEHKDDGPDSSWYRSLLRRLRSSGDL